MLKDDLNNREFTGKVLTSAGMGKQYFERGDWKFNKYNGENTREYYVFKNGTRAMMPRYYKDKIYSEEEKELLWLQKLDKGDTWVMGEKCKIDSDEYKNLLSYYREQATLDNNTQGVLDIYNESLEVPDVTLNNAVVD